METKIFDIKLPTSWEELTDKQLLLVYELFARDLSAAEVKTLCIIKWNRLKVRASLPDHRFLIKRKGESEVALSARQIQQATSELDFLDSFALTPVRISVSTLRSTPHQKRQRQWYYHCRFRHYYM